MISLRTKIEAIILLLLGVSIFLLHIYYNKYIDTKSQKTNIELLFSKKTAEVELYKNRQGQLVAKNEAVLLENKSIKDLVKDGNLQFLSEFNNLKKSYKNLEFAYSALTKSVDSLHIKLKDTIKTIITTKGDTIKFKAYSWKYNDKWGEFSSNQITPDSVDFKYSVTVPINGVLYWKRKWFLGKKTYYSEVTSENPHVNISKLLNLKVGK